MKKVEKRDDLAGALSKLDDAAEYVRRKLTRRLDCLTETETREEAGLVPLAPPPRMTLLTDPDGDLRSLGLHRRIA